jgi:hypothetical protein
VAYLNHQIRRKELIGSSGPNPFTARKILLMLLADERPTTARRRCPSGDIDVGQLAGSVRAL